MTLVFEIPGKWQRPSAFDRGTNKRDLGHTTFSIEDTAPYNLKEKKKVGQGTHSQDKSENEIRHTNLNNNLNFQLQIFLALIIETKRS